MESGATSQVCAALRREIERALRRAFDPADVLPRLVRLSKLAPPQSDDGVFAHRQLAELIVERHPWRAALYARRALLHRKHDDRAWAILALSQTLLGNYRSAVIAYREATAAAPSNPWYAHNLGHLLDVALGDAKASLPWLQSAYAKKSDNSEIVASYVHALARAGQAGEARAVLDRALARFSSRELEALLRWLDQGAPAQRAKAGRPKRARAASSASAPSTAASSVSSVSSVISPGGRERRPEERWQDVLDDETTKLGGRMGKKVAEALEQGMSHLPLNARQRARALALAREVVAETKRRATVQRLSDMQQQLEKDNRCKRDGLPLDPPISRPRVRRPSQKEEVAEIAAAVAYAIVHLDHIPLSQAEVAAPFRVAVGRLRGRFAEICANLDIVTGDRRLPRGIPIH